MSLATFSLIIGAVYYVFGFPLVFSDKKFVDWLERFMKDEDVMRVLALPLVCIAVVTLGRQGVVTPDAEGFIVALAWLTLFKGLLMAWRTESYGRIVDRAADFMLSSQMSQIFCGIVFVIFGAFFTYLGLILP